MCTYVSDGRQRKYCRATNSFDSNIAFYYHIGMTLAHLNTN